MSKITKLYDTIKKIDKEEFFLNALLIIYLGTEIITIILELIHKRGAQVTLLLSSTFVVLFGLYQLFLYHTNKDEKEFTLEIILYTGLGLIILILNIIKVISEINEEKEKDQEKEKEQEKEKKKEKKR